VHEHHAAEREQGRGVVPRGRNAPAVASGAGSVLALQGLAGNAAVVQRLGEDGAPATDAHTRCGGAVMTGTSVDEAGGGNGAEQMSAGGTATQQLGWGDFADADESLDLDAQTGYRFSSTGSTFTATFDAAGSWAKPSAKTGTGNHDLLRHEQYHLDLAILMAQKATAAGHGGQAAMNTLVSRCNNQTALYDTQTAHGTIAAQQSAWEGRIDAGTVPYA
jgi:hypothetical protein